MSSYRDAKAHCSAKNVADQIANLGALRSVKCNATGSQVSILISQVNGQHATTNLYLKLCWELMLICIKGATSASDLFSVSWHILWITPPPRLMDDLITKCTSMMLRWTLWRTLTSSLADRPVVSYSQKKVKGKQACFWVCLSPSHVEASLLPLLYAADVSSVFQAAVSGDGV